MKFRIGAHVSITGGFQNAIKNQEKIKGNCGQIFTHSPRMWKEPNIDESQAKEFQKLSREKDIGPWMSHAAYLINMSSSSDELWKKSVNMVKKELLAAEKLGLQYVVFHPGSHGGAGIDKGLDRLVKGINETKDIAPNVTLLVENMAGTGNIICDKFDQLKYVLDNSKRKNIGICLDTCHAFSAGYDVATKEGLEKTKNEIKSTIGFESIKMIHLNDSQTSLGGKKDRHENIGLGEIGKEGMKRIINDKDLSKIPFVLETPITDKTGHEQDIQLVKNMRE